MAVITFQPPSDVCSCTITVGGQTSQQVPVQEVSSLGAVVAYQGSVRRHEYADVSVFVQGKEVLSLFAHIVNVRSEVIHLRWLHLGPGEAESLAMQLADIFAKVDGVRRAEAESKDFAWRQEQGTRRIVRPRADAKPDPLPAASEQPEAERRSTRKIVRPRARKQSDTDIDLEAVVDENEAAGQVKRETRRIVRPRQVPVHPEPTAPEAEHLTSRARRVVKPQKPAPVQENQSQEDQALDDQPAARRERRKGPSSSSRLTVVPRQQEDDRQHPLSFDDDDEAAEDEAQPSSVAAAGEAQALQPRQSTPPSTDEIDMSGGSPAAEAKPASATKNKPAGWRQGTPAAAQEDQLALVNTERLAKMPASQSSDDESAKPESPDEKVSAAHRDAASQKILSRARTVQASELAARHDKVRVLNMSTIKELIKESVAEAMVDMNTGMDASRLAEEVERRVDEQLQAFKAEKDDVEARAQRLEAELQKAKQAIEREQQRHIEANQFTISDAGIADIERRLERLVAAAIRRNGVNDVLADELRAMVSHILDDERDKIAENARKAQAETIQLLERKISRLSSNLDESQKDQQRAKRMLEALQQSGGGGALRNVMTAGLDEDDPEAERKKDLMRDIMAQNRAIREQMKEKGMSVPAPRKEAESTAETEPSPTQGEETQPAANSSADTAPVAEDDSIDDDSSTDDDQGDIIDPDDMPWEGPPEDTEEDDRPIKRLEVSVKSAAAKAPPLQIRRREGDSPVPPTDEHDRLATEVDDDTGSDPAQVDASLDMDPDDMPWEPPSDDVASQSEGDSPIKRISASSNAQPPPLQRGG